MALSVIEHKTVDSALWADAAEWLMLHGPQSIKELIHQASVMANGELFPAMEPVGFNQEGEPCYEVKELAEILDISEEELLQQLEDKERRQGVRHVFEKSETKKIQ